MEPFSLLNIHLYHLQMVEHVDTISICQVHGDVSPCWCYFMLNKFTSGHCNWTSLTKMISPQLLAHPVGERRER